MGVRLPAEYQEVEYIQGTGPQYIRTDINGVSGLRFLFKFMLTSITPGAPLFGCYGYNQRCYVLSTTVNNNMFSCAYLAARTTTAQASINTCYVAEVDFRKGNQVVIINGENVLSFSDTANLDTANNIFLFGYNFNGQHDDRYQVHMKLFSFSIYDENNTAIREYIPCYRKSDSEPGMYDLVTGEFFVNQGTGEFLVGPDVIGSISPLMVAWRRALLAQAQEAGVLATATGNPMTFTTDLVRPLKSLVIPFASSTGKINIALRGKNYLNAVDVYDDQTSIKVGSVRRFLLLVPNGTYTVSTNCTYTSGVASVFVGASSVYNDTMSTGDNGCSPTIPRTLTVSDGKIVIGVRCSTSVGLVVTRTMLESGEIEIQVEKGGYATEYAKYSGSNLAVDWQSEFGLISNGTLELTEDGNANITTGGSNYHLDNVGRITTFDGTNTIWTDTNGTNTAEYWIKNT